jgi:hypothetical protein
MIVLWGVMGNGGKSDECGIKEMKVREEVLVGGLEGG